MDKISTDSLIGVYASVVAQNKDQYVTDKVASLSLDSFVKIHEEIPSPVDRLLVDRTIVGCCKVILEYYSDFNSIRRRTNKHRTKKAMAVNSILNQVFRGRKDETFRPYQLRSKFPDEIKDMQPADLSETLRSLRHHGDLSRLTQNVSKRSHRGRSSVLNDNGPVFGKDSRYRCSDFVNEVTRIFSNSAASRKHVFWLLVESGLLWKYIYGFYLELLIHIKFVPRSVKEINHHTYEPWLSRILDMDDSAIQDEAANMARVVYQTMTDDSEFMLELYLRGALAFFAYNQV